MSRYKVFDSTGIATAGRVYSGDLNGIQDLKADVYDLAQNLGAAQLEIGETGLLLVRYGANEARLTGALRTDGILRGLGGLSAGAFTTTQRNAIASGKAPFMLIIFNTTTNRYEWNQGTDGARDWQPLSPPIGAGSIGTTEIADASITLAKLNSALQFSSLWRIATLVGGAAAWTEITTDASGAGVAITMPAGVVADGVKDFIVEVYSEALSWTSGGSNGTCTAWLQRSADDGGTWQANGVKVGHTSGNQPSDAAPLAAKRRYAALSAATYRWRLSITGTNGTPILRAGTGADNTVAPAYLAVWVKG